MLREEAAVGTRALARGFVLGHGVDVVEVPVAGVDGIDHAQQRLRVAAATLENLDMDTLQPTERSSYLGLGSPRHPLRGIAPVKLQVICAW